MIKQGHRNIPADLEDGEGTRAIGSDIGRVLGAGPQENPRALSTLWEYPCSWEGNEFTLGSLPKGNLRCYVDGFPGEFYQMFQEFILILQCVPGNRKRKKCFPVDFRKLVIP